jgi:hypothetical protein
MSQVSQTNYICPGRIRVINRDLAEICWANKANADIRQPEEYVRTGEILVQFMNQLVYRSHRKTRVCR